MESARATRLEIRKVSLVVEGNWVAEQRREGFTFVVEQDPEIMPEPRAKLSHMSARELEKLLGLIVSASTAVAALAGMNEPRPDSDGSPV